MWEEDKADAALLIACMDGNVSISRHTLTKQNKCSSMELFLTNCMFACKACLGIILLKTNRTWRFSVLPMVTEARCTSEAKTASHTHSGLVEVDFI